MAQVKVQALLHSHTYGKYTASSVVYKVLQDLQSGGMCAAGDRASTCSSGEDGEKGDASGNLVFHMGPAREPGKMLQGSKNFCSNSRSSSSGSSDNTLEAVHLVPCQSHFRHPRQRRHSQSRERTTRGRLRAAVHSHAEAEDGRVFIVLATSGYDTMLRNFLCSASRALQMKTNSSSDTLQETSERVKMFTDGDENRDSEYFHKLPILVLTFDPAVAATARAAGAGAYVASAADLQIDENDNDDEDKETEEKPEEEPDAPSALNEAAFGSQAYQLLMLFRTRAVWEVLSMGYSPVVADIDTVWLQNPLFALRRAEKAISADVTVALDGTPDLREICGCFVALRYRTNAHINSSGNDSNSNNSIESASTDGNRSISAALALWTEVKVRHIRLLKAWYVPISFNAYCWRLAPQFRQLYRQLT